MLSASRKELTLILLTVAAGVLNAYFWKDALLTGGFQRAAFYSLPVLALFLFAILFSLAATFIRTQALRVGSAVVSVVAGFVFVPFHPYLPFLAAFGFFVAVKAFTLPVYWVTLILFGLVVKSLLAVGLLTEKTEKIEVTRVIL